MRWMFWPGSEYSSYASDLWDENLQPWNIWKNTHLKCIRQWASKLTKGLQRYGKSSQVVKEELLGRSGAKCLCWPLLLPPCSYICLTPGRKKAPEGLLGTSPSLSHISVLCGFTSGVALVGKDGCSGLLTGKWMDRPTPPSSLAKPKVSHAPLWCGLHFTRNAAAAGPKEERALVVTARKHHWVLLICNNAAPSWVLSWET